MRRNPSFLQKTTLVHQKCESASTGAPAPNAMVARLADQRISLTFLYMDGLFFLFIERLGMRLDQLNFEGAKHKAILNREMKFHSLALGRAMSSCPSC